MYINSLYRKYCIHTVSMFSQTYMCFYLSTFTVFNMCILVTVKGSSARELPGFHKKVCKLLSFTQIYGGEMGTGNQPCFAQFVVYMCNLDLRFLWLRLELEGCFG